MSQEVILNREQMEDQTESDRIAQLAAYLKSQPQPHKADPGRRESNTKPENAVGALQMCYDEELRNIE